MKLEQKTITSIEVAEMVGKDHKNILRDVRGYAEELGVLKIEPSDFFQESTYVNQQNKELPCYNVTKKGCEFIGNKLTGIKGTEFTAKYINRFHQMEEVIKTGFEGLSPELQAIFAHDKKIQAVIEHMEQNDNRLDHIENTMVIDYGQQLVLKNLVNVSVINWLGGKDSNAYKNISKVVFSECNKDIQHYFNVNSRNNIPRIKFDDAVKYVKNWEPCHNTKLLIQDHNNQLNLDKQAM